MGRSRQLCHPIRQGWVSRHPCPARHILGEASWPVSHIWLAQPEPGCIVDRKPRTLALHLHPKSILHLPLSAGHCNPQTPDSFADGRNATNQTKAAPSCMARKETRPSGSFGTGVSPRWGWGVARQEGGGGNYTLSSRRQSRRSAPTRSQPASALLQKLNGEEGVCGQGERSAPASHSARSGASPICQGMYLPATPHSSVTWHGIGPSSPLPTLHAFLKPPRFFTQ